MSAQKITPEQIKTAGELIRKLDQERQELKKEATAHELEKRAAKIAFREVELGIAQPFESMQAFQEKVASILAEGDLDVVEKALERGYTGSRKTSELAGSSPANGKNPFERFVLTGELDNE